MAITNRALFIYIHYIQLGWLCKNVCLSACVFLKYYACLRSIEKSAFVSISRECSTVKNSRGTDYDSVV